MKVKFYNFESCNDGYHVNTSDKFFIREVKLMKLEIKDMVQPYLEHPILSFTEYFDMHFDTKDEIYFALGNTFMIIN